MYSVFLAKNKLVRRLEQDYLQAYLLAKHCSKQFERFRSNDFSVTSVALIPLTPKLGCPEFGVASGFFLFARTRLEKISWSQKVAISDSFEIFRAC